MPDYTIRDPQSGKTVTVRGESAPTEAELEQIFAGTTRQSAAAPPPEITPENWRQAVGKGQVIFSNRVVGTVAQNAPTIGGAIGGTVAGVPGAVAGGMAGERLRQYANALTGKEALPGQLDATGRMLTQGAIQGAMQYGGEKVPEIAGKLGRAVYRSYLKPSLAASNIRDAETIVDTAIREALPISKGGVAKANSLISGLNAEVKDELARTPGQVDLQAVADRVRQWATKQFYKPGVPSADYDAALAVANSIDHHASLASEVMRPVEKTVETGLVNEGGQPILRTVTTQQPTTVYRQVATPLEANSIKQGLQKAGADATLMERAATKQAQEAGGHEARLALEQLAPKIAPLNARESKLIDAASAINRAVQREANQYVAHGTKAMVGAVVGGEEYRRTGDPYMAAAKGLATTVALQPAVASRLAIVASRLGQVSRDAPPMIARVALAAILTGADAAKNPE